MKIQLIIVFVLLFVVFINFTFSQNNCTKESFTNNVNPTYTCAKGGIIDDKNICTSKITATRGCTLGYDLQKDTGLCCSSRDQICKDQTWICPDHYTYDEKEGMCTKTYRPIRTCPSGYTLKMTELGYTCKN